MRNEYTNEDREYTEEELRYMLAQKQAMNRKKKKKKKKRHISSEFFWLILFIASAVFFVTFWMQPMFPRKWSFLVLALLAGMLLLTGIFTSILSSRNRLQKLINISLAIAVSVCAMLLPYEVSKVSAIFNSALGNKVRINLYAMTDSYKQAHSETFVNTIELPEQGTQVKDLSIYADAVFGSSVAADTENQQYAMNEIKNLCGGEVQIIDRSTVSEAVAQLYANHTDILVMAESYASVISDMEGYENFAEDTQVIYSFVRTFDESAGDKIDVKMTSEPFTIFFGGNDEEGELVLNGRTDVDMVVSVNPNTHQIAIINMPRDSYIPNPVFKGSKDKLTHFGLQGMSNTLEGLSDYLDVKIPNYVLVNFTTYMNIIGSIGGVDVDNPYEFYYSYDNSAYFPEGRIHLEGWDALAYVRERHSLPDGDFGRNMHQQLVMQAIIEKITSPEVIANFNSILDGMNGQFLTNISTDSMYALIKKQLNENIDWNIVKYHVTGEVGVGVCASVDNVTKLSVVYPYPNQVEFVRKVIDAVENGDTIEQEELPYGTFEEEPETTAGSETY